LYFCSREISHFSLDTIDANQSKHNYMTYLSCVDIT
jgi:hypothetical protein